MNYVVSTFRIRKEFENIEEAESLFNTLWENGSTYIELAEIISHSPYYTKSIKILYK